jgi:phosphatidylglycerophosphatase A
MSNIPGTPAPMQAQGRTSWGWIAATFFGAGFAKPGPGTWGSLAAVLLWAAYAGLMRPTATGLDLALLAGIVLSVLFGVPAATIVERECGRRDPGFIVIDEVAGQWVALLGSRPAWRGALLALALFRVFDIAKPFPIRRLERLPGGWGIVFDDLGAGLYALGVGCLLRHFIVSLQG